MITVPEATKKIIMRSRYLNEALSKGIINTSSLARYIKPELEEMLMKKVSNSAIIMALNRLSLQIHPGHSTKNIFKSPPDMILRSNLIALIVPNLKNQDKAYEKIFGLSNSNNFLVFSHGFTQTIIIANRTLENKIKNILGVKNIQKIDNLSAVTIQLPESAIDTPGIFYFFLKSLAWEGINIVEIISSALELNLVFKKTDASRAYTILSSLFSEYV